MKVFQELSIKSKLILMQIITCFIVLGLCSIAFVITDIKGYKERRLESGRAIAQVVATNSVSVLDFDDKEAAGEMLSDLKVQTDVLNATILDKYNKPFANYKRPGIEVYKFNYTTDSKKKAEFEGNNLIVYENIERNQEVLGAICIRMDLSQLDKLIQNKINIATMVLILGIIIALIISIIIQGYISTPLLYLSSIMQEIKEQGDYKKRSKLKGGDEAGRMSQVFNDMLQEIEKKDSELELRFKEQEAFSYSVSHDLKAPLRAINGFASVINNRYKDTLPEDAKELFEIISSNAKKMGRLIEDLLVFSRLGRSEIKKDTIDMNKMVEAVIQEARQTEPERQVELNITDLPAAKGDVNMIRQVWRNLIFNAWKYTGHNPDAKIKIGSYKANKEVVYFIEDNGVGFDMKYVNKLFGVFQRLHTDAEFEGTGIGLAIVQKILTRHNGRAWVKAEVGKGAKFFFTIGS